MRVLYGASAQQHWIDALPVDQLLPALRRIVRGWQRGSEARADRRVANFVEGRPAAGAAAAAAAAAAGAESAESSSEGSGSELPDDSSEED